MTRTPKRPGAFTRRALLLGAGQLGIFGALAAKLYQVQIVEGERYATLSDNNRISARLIAPPRGRVLDRHGAVVAGNRLNWRALLVAEQAGDAGAVLDIFSQVLPLAEHGDVHPAPAGADGPLVTVVADRRGEVEPEGGRGGGQGLLRTPGAVTAPRATSVTVRRTGGGQQGQGQVAAHHELLDVEDLGVGAGQRLEDGGRDTGAVPTGEGGQQRAAGDGHGAS